MSPLAHLTHSLRIYVPATLLLLGFAATPRALAVTNAELLPANLVGKTLTFTHTAATPNTLEPTINTYTITFTTASAFTRVLSPVLQTQGSYSVLDSSISPVTGSQVTLLQISSNWYATGNNTSILLTLTHAGGFGAFAAAEFFNPLKNSGGTLTIAGGSSGGTVTPPVITSANTASATIGTPFTFQIAASNSPTVFGVIGAPTWLNLNVQTGVLSGTPPAGAVTTTVALSALNAGGPGTQQLTITVSGGAVTRPLITSPIRVTATAGVPFTYQITTTSPAASFTRTGGALELSVNSTTGLVTGTFANAGEYTLSFTTTNSAGTDNAIIIITVAGAGTGQLGSGLVAYYKFENNANDSAGTNHGTQQGGVTYAASRSGFGQAASFSGVNQFISIPHNAGFNAGTAGLTVSLWINTSNPKAASSGSRLVDKGTSGLTDGWTFDTFDISRASRNVVRLASTTIGVNSTSRFASDTWQHIVFVYSGGTVTFYVNGLAAGSGSVGTLVNNTLPLQLGAPRGSAANGEFYFGLMDEVRIYSRAITAAEITALANGDQTTTGLGGGTTTFADAPSNLVGYRNKVGQTYQFTVTGSSGGAVWGSDVYTDDSTVARAAVHAGVLAVGETKAVTITLLGGQTSYAASSRNGVTTSSWGAWPGSYAFSGATGGTATARPTVASGFTVSTGTLAVGGRFVLPITITGGGIYTYQWYLNNVLIAGATANPYVVESITTGNAGTYTVDVTNSLGTARLSAGSLTVGAAGSPVIALQPLSKIVVPGATVSFATSATGAGLTYQWFRNNVALAGETGAILLRQNVNAADAGSYTVRITNGSGSVTSTGGTLTLSPNASRPANISVRTNVATGAIVTPGFFIQGGGTKRVLIRAVGPGLGAFGLTGVMSDPKFTVFQGQTQVATNDDWSATNVGNAFSATGAFPLPSSSKDAALVTDLAAGKDYTVQVTNATGAGGIVLIEVYDADILTGTSTSKLVNVSVRGQTAPGDDVLTLGLVIGGTGQRTLLIRGIGPKLAAFGVSGTVADPRLQIFDSQQRSILANDDWNNADFVSELVTASGYVGAFALDAGSKDAATLSLLDPGAYTIQVSGAAAAPTGEALVEVYEVP